jgi:hypothetical protein
VKDGSPLTSQFVMAGLVPAIHVFKSKYYKLCNRLIATTRVF